MVVTLFGEALDPILSQFCRVSCSRWSMACAVFIFTYSQQILGILNPAYPVIAGMSLRFIGFGLLGVNAQIPCLHAGAVGRRDGQGISLVRTRRIAGVGLRGRRREAWWA
jgi:hypothetical protein